MEKSYLDYTGKAEVYERYRPLYSNDILEKIINITGFNNEFVLADIGSGTGRLTELFINRAKDIYAIEPNNDMRHQAELKFSNYNSFHSINGFADNTGLNSSSIDLILCGQAIHWFTPETTLKEFKRILKDDGWIICVWNKFKEEEYPQIYDFIDIDTIQIYSFPLTFKEDFNSYLGGAVSASYNPNPEDENFDEFKKGLKSEFDKKAVNNLLTINYETVLVLGKIKK